MMVNKAKTLLKRPLYASVELFFSGLTCIEGSRVRANGQLRTQVSHPCPAQLKFIQTNDQTTLINFLTLINKMYTSKLPISTSVRRPTHHADGSTSFVGLTRPSNIPVTVRKANLFTPQTKRPYSNGASTAGKSYMSGMTTDKKYQRVAKPDRDLQSKMFDTLVDYLKVNAPHLPTPEAKKFFSSVSTTESARIFEFLISRILPDFKINRLEIDVPEALALLDYPYIRSVTKSALVSVTTRQAAVGLLVIFYWLIGTINQIENVNSDGFEDEDEPVDERCEIYKNILMHPERIGEANRKVFECLYPREDFQARLDDLEHTKAEIDQLNEHLIEIDELKQEALTLEEDMHKCKEYTTLMEKYFTTKRSEEDELKQQSLRLDIKNEERLRRKDKILLEIKNHDLDIEEVKRNQAVVDNLESKRLHIREQVANAHSEKDKAEGNLQRLLSKFKEKIEENTTQMKNLLQTYDSQRDVESEHWGERRLEIREWMIRLEQLPHDDLAQNHRLQHEQSLFIQKLRATNLSLESEIRDGMSDKKIQLENLEFSNEKYPKEVLPRLQEALKRTERDCENDRRQYMDNLSKIDVQTEEEARQTTQLQEKYQELEATVVKDKALEEKRLRSDYEESSLIAELNMKHLRSVLERTSHQATSLVKEAERESGRWQEYLKIATENNQVAKSATELLAKHLKL